MFMATSLRLGRPARGLLGHRSGPCCRTRLLRSGWSKPPARKPAKLPDDIDIEYYYEEEDDAAAAAAEDVAYYEEYYYDEEDEVAVPRGKPALRPLRSAGDVPLTANLPRALRHGEHVGLVSLPEALDDALMEHTVPRLRSALKVAKQAGSVEDRQPTVDDFAAFRLDRTYAACYRTLHEVNCRLPGFAPVSILEFGAYLGSGSWAAHTVWPPEDLPDGAAAARSYVAVEPNPLLRAAGAELSEAALPEGPLIAWQAEVPPEVDAAANDAFGAADDALGAADEETRGFDLVIAPYSLSSLPAAGVPAALDMLWRRTAVGGVLAIVEAASEASAATVKRARQHLEEVTADARLVAPFPHQGLGATSVFSVGGESLPSEPWPIKAYRRSFSKGSTLQVTQRVLESSAAREFGLRTDPARKGKERRVNKEPFAYLLYVKEAAGAARAGADAAERMAAAPPDAMWGSMAYGRVLGTPRKRTKHVLLDVLTSDGRMGSYTVTKRTVPRADYRYARKAKEGNTLPMELIGEVE